MDLSRRLRFPARLGPLGRRRGHLALVLSAARAADGGGGDRLRGRHGDPRAGRHDLVRDGLAAAAAAFRPRDGAQRLHRRVRDPGDRRTGRDVPLDLAEPQLPAGGGRQAGAGLAGDPAGDLGDPQRLHRPPGVGVGLGGGGAEHHRPARRGDRCAGFGLGGAGRPAADAALADQARRAADRRPLADQYRQQFRRKPDHPRPPI